MKDLVKKNVKPPKDSRYFIYNRYKDRFSLFKISYKQFLEDTQTGEYTWKERYEKRGLMDIIDYTTDWTSENYEFFYKSLTFAINNDIEEELISERPV